MWYVINCSSVWDSSKIIEKYPIIRDYNYKCGYPYPNSLLVRIEDLIKFMKDINEDIIIRKDMEKEFIILEIYDDWRE